MEFFEFSMDESFVAGVVIKPRWNPAYTPTKTKWGGPKATYKGLGTNAFTGQSLLQTQKLSTGAKNNAVLNPGKTQGIKTVPIAGTKVFK